MNDAHAVHAWIESSQVTYFGVDIDDNIVASSAGHDVYKLNSRIGAVICR
jgi:hypothetical protein